MSRSYEVNAEFVAGETCQLFTVNVAPSSGPSRGAIVYLPPLADEMHKSRRTVAQQARALATAGYHVTLLDLPGCGDSGGEFADATWQIWKAEARRLAEGLTRQLGLPVSLWGLRLGALLACDIAQELTNLDKLLLWQPTLNGEQHLDQFLRVELAGQALMGKKGFERSELWEELRSGRSLVVAGYELGSTLALEMSRVRLGDMQPSATVHWMDIGAEGQPINIANNNVLSEWEQRGITVQWQRTAGELFWRNVDAPDSPCLMTATVQALS